jgi:hypothetical protein
MRKGLNVASVPLTNGRQRRALAQRSAAFARGPSLRLILHALGERLLACAN